ncbi:MAG TPA: rhomboid family intramembrane serine protease [Thermomicrobiales bacterium]|jgi:membrane associated rhomboid family serine protease
MFPIGDENRGQRLRPVVNYGLIALNFLVFFYELAQSDPELNRFIYRWGTIPTEIMDGQRLVTLVTSQFLHAGWLHILGNMLFLWVFGDNVEDTMGHVGYLIFYLLCGVAAAVAQVAVNSGSPTPLVGASGAISGVLAAYLVLFPRGKIRTFVLLGWFPLIFLLPAWVMIGYWIVLQFINGFLSLGVRTEEGSGVAYFAHVGGFLAGLVLVNLFKNEDAHQRQLAAREGRRAFQRVGWDRG